MPDCWKRQRVFAASIVTTMSSVAPPPLPPSNPLMSRCLRPPPPPNPSNHFMDFFFVGQTPRPPPSPPPLESSRNSEHSTKPPKGVFCSSLFPQYFARSCFHARCGVRISTLSFALFFFVAQMQHYCAEEWLKYLELPRARTKFALICTWH